MRLTSRLGALFGLLLALSAANLAVWLALQRERADLDRLHSRHALAVGMAHDLAVETAVLAQLAQRLVIHPSAADHQLRTDIWSVREGRMPPPVEPGLGAYWQHRAVGAAAGIDESIAPTLPRATLLQRLQAAGLDDDELAAAQVLLASAMQLRAWESRVLAVADGTAEVQADPAWALRLLQAPTYEVEQRKLDRALTQLTASIRAHGEARLEASQRRLDAGWRIAAGGLLLSLLAVLAIGFWMRVRVLRPLSAVLDQLPPAPSVPLQEATPASPWPAELQALSRRIGALLEALQQADQRHQADQAALQLARSVEADAVEAINRFLAGISLEIRAPLNTVSGMLQLCLQTPTTALQREYLTSAETAAHALLGLVNDVLDYARLEAGHLHIDTQPLALEAVVGQAIEWVRSSPVLQPSLSGATHPLELLVEWADAALLAEHGRLLGDAVRLQQVLVNLLSNAIKFTAAGQILLRVDRVAAASPSEPAQIKFTVQDTGQGMTPTQLSELFGGPDAERPVPTRRYGGGGLGLIITHRLVTLMGGRIQAFSHLGLGSRFEVHIPMARDESAAALPGCPLELQRAQVLVTEDQTDSRNLLLATLRTLGIAQHGELHSADCAAQTRLRLQAAAAAGRPFDWLLLEWLLPDARGAELLAELRRDHPALRVVVVSAFGHDEVRRQARGLGACDFLLKPVQPADIRRAMFESGQHPPSASTGLSLAGLRALLVEDHPINRDIAQRLLASRGARVEVCCNGQEAVSHLIERGPQAYDVVLMDLQMPVLDGLEATRRLRALPEFERLPIVAMTAHALSEERDKCLAAGMQGHIAKPLDLPVLVRELQPYLPLPGRPGSDTRIERARSAPAPAKPQHWPTLHGIDVAAGLAFFDQQQALYRRSLNAFAAQYASGLQEWQGWLEPPQWPELRRAAHSLQGLAATLGIKAVHQAAARLEQAAAAQDLALARQALPTLQEQLAPVIDSIQATFKDPPGMPATAPAPVPAEMPAAEWAELVDRLQRLLSHSDSQALELWGAHGATFKARLATPTWQALDHALSEFDFDAALHALRTRSGAHPA